MRDGQSHPLLQQTPLSVNPFIDLPKPPTLAHNYATIPSTLPPSSIAVASSASGSNLAAYVTSASGFKAHPSTIIAQNKVLLEQIEQQREQAEEKVKKWEMTIQERELAEKRRKAPGWLDSESKLLEPAKPSASSATTESMNLMDTTHEVGSAPATSTINPTVVDDLGDAMDRAFGKGGLH